MAKWSTDIACRQAMRADSEKLVQFYNDYVVNSTATFALNPETTAERESWLDLHASLRYPVEIVTIDGVVEGFASLSPYHARCAYALTAEVSIYLSPQARGHRLGDALLGKLHDHADKMGLHTLLALVCSENKPSIALFERNGYELSGTLRQVGKKFDRYLDVAIYQWIKSK